MEKRDQDAPADTGPRAGDTRPKPLARATEQRRTDRIYDAVAEILGPDEARRLVDLAESERAEFETEWLKANRQRIKDTRFDSDTLP